MVAVADAASANNDTSPIALIDKTVIVLRTAHLLDCVDLYTSFVPGGARWSRPEAAKVRKLRQQPVLPGSRVAERGLAGRLCGDLCYETEVLCGAVKAAVEGEHAGAEKVGEGEVFGVVGLCPSELVGELPGSRLKLAVRPRPYR